jgi:MYXO-CTERM domain-containing protein
MGAHGAGETAIVSALVGLVLASRRRRRSVV